MGREHQFYKVQTTLKTSGSEVFLMTMQDGFRDICVWLNPQRGSAFAAECICNWPVPSSDWSEQLELVLSLSAALGCLRWGRVLCFYLLSSWGWRVGPIHSAWCHRPPENQSHVTVKTDREHVSSCRIGSLVLIFGSFSPLNLKLTILSDLCICWLQYISVFLWA